MHEWALAEAIVRTVSETAKKERLKQVTEVKIVIGELQQIEKRYLEFALGELKTKNLQKTKFSIEAQRGELKCRNCGHRWVFNQRSLYEDASEAIHFLPEIAHVYIKCPKCGSPDFEVLAGRGVTVQSVAGVTLRR